MDLHKIALDGRFVCLEPLEERHRELVRPAAQHPEIVTVTTSTLGNLYDPYIDGALKRSDAVHELAFVVFHKASGRYVGMTRYLNIEEAHKKLEIGSTWYEPSVWAGGYVRDSVIFSIVDTHWPAAKAGLEKRLAA